jgi:hypothetical protein
VSWRRREGEERRRGTDRFPLSPATPAPPPLSPHTHKNTASTSAAATATTTTTNAIPRVIPASRVRGPAPRGDPRYWPRGGGGGGNSVNSGNIDADPDNSGYSDLRRRWDAGAPLPAPNARRLRLRNQEDVRKRPAAAAGHASWLPLPTEARGELRAALEASGLSPAAAATVADAAARRPQGARGPSPPADPDELARRVRHLAAAQRAAVAAASASSSSSSTTAATAAALAAPEPPPLAGLDLDAALRRRDRAGLGSGCGDQRGALLWMPPGKFDARVRYLGAQLAEAARPAVAAAAAGAAAAGAAPNQQQRKLGSEKGYDVGAVMTAAPGLAMRAPKELARRAAAWPTLLREGLRERAEAEAEAGSGSGGGLVSSSSAAAAAAAAAERAPLLPPSALNSRHAGVLTRPVPRVRERAGALGARLGPDAAALALARAPALLSRRGRLVSQRMHHVKCLLMLERGEHEQQEGEQEENPLAALVARAPRVLLTPAEALAARLDAVAAAMSGDGARVSEALAAARAAPRRGRELSFGGGQAHEQEEDQDGGAAAAPGWSAASIGWRSREVLELLAEEAEGGGGGNSDGGGNSGGGEPTASVLSPAQALRAATAAARACPAALMSKSPPAVRAHVEALREMLGFPAAASEGDDSAAAASSGEPLVAALLRAHPALLTRSANSVRSVAVTLSKHSASAPGGGGGGGGGGSGGGGGAGLAALDPAGLRAAALAAPPLLALSTNCLDARLAAWEALAAGGARWAAALRELRASPESLARALTAAQPRYARLAWLAEAAAREEPPPAGAAGGGGLESLVLWDDAAFKRAYPAF